MKIIGIICLSYFLSTLLVGQSLVWPTPNRAFINGEELESFIQPTSSGEITSGLFGCVRNDGERFHEALDLKPKLKRRNGEATDPIYAAYDGRVVHVNKVAGLSSYGRYIVLEHHGIRPAIYTLYAHLSVIDDSIVVGQELKAGTVLGIMGRSAGGYTIPRSRAHLHFEIGLRLSSDFQHWYDQQSFGSKNTHGNYNGMNLVGWDPLEFFSQNRDDGQLNPFDYLNQLEPGFVVRIRSKHTPDFVKRYPELKISGVPDDMRKGWEIRFTAWGLPLTFEAIGDAQVASLEREGSYALTSINPDELERYACRNMVQKVGTRTLLGRGGEDLIEILFRF